jgi:hypothetical protein
VTEDDFDLSKFRLDLDTTPTIKAPRVPEKIRKRREQFVQIPMWCLAVLAQEPIASGSTFYLAGHLWHLDFINYRKPFNLGNGMLAYDGISRQTKWRALRNLEQRGLVRVECRDSKSPIIHMIRRPLPARG